jgi:eukaryotic-like serine/threonine-protein kinase
MRQISADGGCVGADIAGVREGDVLAGKYRIDKILGAGGMGVVVAAHHVRLDEKVAIKFLLPETLGNAEAVARFEREARAAVKIKSEHVARVTDVGTLETGAPYMVMEYLEGGDLSAWVEQRGALPIEQAVEFVLQACDAMADAHSLGIIHRDLKPANLFCIQRNDGFFSVKVLDFGISKTTGMAGSGPDMGMTKTTAVMGSPYYMSPEQVQASRNVDPRSDIWSIGVILYELLSGRVPFGGETIAELVLKIMTGPAPPLRELRPDVPEGLEAVVLRCLEKDRARRYSNVGELAVALAPFGPRRLKALVERIVRVIQAAGMSASALALPPSSDAAQSVPAATAASWGHTKPEPGRKRATILIIAASASLAAIAAVVVTVFALRRPTTPEIAATVVTASAPPAAAPSPPATTQATTPPPAPSPPPIPSASALPPQLPPPPKGGHPGPASTHSVPQPPPKPAAKPNVSCDPPYTIDGSGHRQYKPECLR